MQNAPFTQYHSQYIAHRITLEGRDDEAFAKSLSTARVDMNPHQVDAALFALKSPLATGVMLADEVGLGKTIEASLVIAQKWAERRRRVLLVVPASLRKQWQQELAEKFSLPSTILETRTYNQAVKEGTRLPFDQPGTIIICSYPFASRKMGDLKQVKWDLAVLDEAHRLRNVYKKNGAKRAKALKEALGHSFKLLLTATPLQNSLMELYGLVSFMDDRHFGNETSFRALYSGTQANEVSRALLKQRLEPIIKRTLRRQVVEAGHINYTNRNAQTFDFEPRDEEALLYEKVSAFLQRTDTISYGDRTNALVILQVRKILGSSTFAVAQYLANLITRLEQRRPIDETVSDDIDVIDEIAEDYAEDDEDAETEEAFVDPVALEAEIEEIRGYLELAQRIGSNAKGEKLISKLPDVLDEIVAKGGQRKAVIFTESTRTQRYLNQLLSENGYAGRIVLMNGSNSDPESRKIYAGWKAKHEGTDRISGSRAADMKAAIVDAFRSDEKTILIATESGAEGINLQFCSLLINFDLPWNPQRVEQRIGRCHRYGQKIDVSVVNMLNRKNLAEARIYELLDQKFHLFDGVFGSSDEVLGTIESGLDFEKKVLGIVQGSRTNEQIEMEFDRLQEELKDTIDAEIQQARAKLIETMDEQVVGRLKARKDALVHTLSEFEKRLFTLARAELPEGVFDLGELPSFTYQGQTYTTRWPEADDKGWHFFRLADDSFADRLVDVAKSRNLPSATVKFDHSLYHGTLVDVRGLVGHSGTLSIAKVRMEAAGTVREELACACVRDDGVTVHPDTVDRLFLVPGELVANEGDAASGEDAQEVQARLIADIKGDMARQNEDWLEQETTKLEAYADDLEATAEAEIKEIEAEIREAKKAARLNTDASMADKIAEKRRIKRLEQKRDDQRLAIFQRRKDIRDDIDRMLDEIAASLDSEPEIEPIFSIRWHVVE